MTGSKKIDSLRKPCDFAKDILNQCDFNEPPICEKIITEYLGLSVIEIKDENLQYYGNYNKELIKSLEKACAWKKRDEDGRSTIYVYGETKYERKRLGIFHECGHEVIPWHQNINYICTENDISLITKKQIEREAFECGTEFLMPSDMFYNDINSLGTNIESIKTLSSRYKSSIEATAIKYVRSHPGRCALVMLEPINNYQRRKKAHKGHLSNQINLTYDEKYNISLPVDSNTKYPLAVKYFVKSNRFEKFIRPGTGIGENNPVYEAYTAQQSNHMEIPASSFGSSCKSCYRVDTLPFIKREMTMLLLWIPYNQTSLF